MDCKSLGAPPNKNQLEQDIKNKQIEDLKLLLLFNDCYRAN
jgi:hypothetical protein